MRSLAILAGGFGTRLRKVVSDVPKPMAPIAGRPFLAWLLDGWLDRDWYFDQVVLLVGYRAEVIRQFFGEQYRGTPVRYIEEAKPLGTGGALVNLCRDLEGEACVINGDTWFMPDRDFSWPTDQSRPAVMMLLKSVDDVGRYDAVSLFKGRYIFSLKKIGSGQGLVNGGVCFMNSAAVSLAASENLAKEPLSLENDIFQSWISGGKCEFFGYTNDMPFIDIGVPETFLRAEKFLMDQR